MNPAKVGNTSHRSCGLCCCNAQVLPLPGLLMCSLHKHINVLRVFILLLCISIILPKPLADTQPSQQPTCQAHAVSPFPASFWLVKTIKTGGTTLAGVLRQICANYGVVPVNKRKFNPLEQLPDAEAAAALEGSIAAAKNATDASDFAIITHLNYSSAKLAAFQSVLGGRRLLLFTSVRHPLARTYSHFIQAKCANAAAMLGGKIIECDRNATYMNKLLELDNIRNRWSFVKVPSRHNLVYNYIRGNGTTVEAALAPYDFVFISERMDEALVMFMLEYGLRLQDIAYLPSKVRTGKYKPSDQMPLELNNYVLNVNQQDLLVWQQANKLLDARRQQLEQQCGATIVQDALASFQALQAKVSKQCADFKKWYAANGFRAEQHTYVNDEGWGWRCVRHVAQMYVEGHQKNAAAAAVGPAGRDAAITVIT